MATATRVNDVGEAFRPPAETLPTRKRNRLSLDVYKGPGRFFVTMTTARRLQWFAQPKIASYCADALRNVCEAERFTLAAYCFMPDHVHILVLSETETDLIGLVHRFKQRTGWWFKKQSAAGGLKASPTDASSALWQSSYYDHVLRRDEDIASVVRYILENPVRAGLVSSAEEHPYSWSIAGVSELA